MSAPAGYNLLGIVGYCIRGNYDPTATYNRYDTVYHDGSTFYAKHDNILNVTPAEGDDWGYLCRGQLDDMTSSSKGIGRPDNVTATVSSGVFSVNGAVIPSHIVAGATEYGSGWLSLTSGGAALTPDAKQLYRIMEGTLTGKVFRWNGTAYVRANPEDEMTGATASDAGAHGLVPAPGAGDQYKFLKGDGSWDIPTEVELRLANGELEEVDLALVSRTQGTPSSTASSSATKRIFDVNTYVVGVNFGNNFNANSASFVSKTANSINYNGEAAYGIGIPFSVQQGVIYEFWVKGTQNSNTMRIGIAGYESDGTYVSDWLVTEPCADNTPRHIIYNPKYGVATAVLCFCGTSTTSTDKIANDIHLYKRSTNEQTDANVVYNSNMGDAFSSSKAYALGEYFIHDNKLYEVTTPCSAGSWATNASCFTQMTIAKGLSYLQSDKKKTEMHFTVPANGQPIDMIFNRTGYQDYSALIMTRGWGAGIGGFYYAYGYANGRNYLTSVINNAYLTFTGLADYEGFSVSNSSAVDIYVAVKFAY